MVNNTKQFIIYKRFSSIINVVNIHDVRIMIAGDQLYASFKNALGIPLYYDNLMLDVLVKVRKYVLYTVLYVLYRNMFYIEICSVFRICSATKFKWMELIQVITGRHDE